MIVYNFCNENRNVSHLDFVVKWLRVVSPRKLLVAQALPRVAG